MHVVSAKAAALFAVAAVLLLGCPASRAEVWSVKSPDGKLMVQVTQNASQPRFDQGNRLYYRVLLGDIVVIDDSQLGLRLDGDGGNLASGLKLTDKTAAAVERGVPRPVRQAHRLPQPGQ